MSGQLKSTLDDFYMFMQPKIAQHAICEYLGIIPRDSLSVAQLKKLIIDRVIADETMSELKKCNIIYTLSKNILIGRERRMMVPVPVPLLTYFLNPKRGGPDPFFPTAMFLDFILSVIVTRGGDALIWGGYNDYSAIATNPKMHQKWLREIAIQLKSTEKSHNSDVTKSAPMLFTRNLFTRLKVDRNRPINAADLNKAEIYDILLSVYKFINRQLPNVEQEAALKQQVASVMQDFDQLSIENKQKRVEDFRVSLIKQINDATGMHEERQAEAICALISNPSQMHRAHEKSEFDQVTLFARCFTAFLGSGLFAGLAYAHRESMLPTFDEIFNMANFDVPEKHREMVYTYALLVVLTVSITLQSIMCPRRHTVPSHISSDPESLQEWSNHVRKTLRP